MMDAQSLRDRFTRFYIDRGHTAVGAAPLVPRDDPSLLFNSAGMVQFKKLWVTDEPLPYTRAVSVQPCLRAGGKDSDIENVGRTPRHCSFFEMLGNFSFGDYFKAEAIEWGWEFLTKEIGLDPSRLWVTVFEEDDEAAALWPKITGIDGGRVVRLGREDNFWGPAGKTGACGPCSEIYWDLGPEYGGQTPGDEGDRYFEVYNLVFPQYDMQEDGTLATLRNRGIDTGMGLERLAQVVQGVGSVFDTDLFTPIIAEVAEITGRSADTDDPEERLAFRVIADHVRGLTFTIAEGIMPSNEGRGYVMRRILRRAARRGFALGVDGAFLGKLSSVVVDNFHRQYPHLDGARERVALAIEAEEARFAATLGTGMSRFEDAVARAKKTGRAALVGDEVFTLYDTYGFPVDLVQEMAEERGLAVDVEGFESAMAEQKARSRAASKFGDEAGDKAEWTTVSGGAHSEFLGYEVLETESRLRRYATGDDGIRLILDRTPFYAESGGQVGDQGEIEGAGFTLRVRDTRRVDGAIVHTVEAPGGFDPAAVGDAPLSARVDAGRRAAIQRNHTATHLLHAALRRVLGTHVAQAGSLVAPDRLRFDFTHFQAMTQGEIESVERDVTTGILGSIPVEIATTSMKEAIEAGAMALFGEKYGDVVRQVIVGETSRELCGGTHVGATSEIGGFLVTQESGVAAGTRRIEALTGASAAEMARRDRDSIARIASTLQSGRASVEEKIEALLAERATLEKALAKDRARARKDALGQALEDVEERAGVRLVARRVEASSTGEMRSAADVLRQKIGSGVAILGAEMKGKASFLVLVTKDLVDAGRFRADEIVREVAKVAGGSGGGKPDLSLAGAKDVSKIDEALARGRAMVLEKLG